MLLVLVECLEKPTKTVLDTGEVETGELAPHATDLMTELLVGLQCGSDARRGLRKQPLQQWEVDTLLNRKVGLERDREILQGFARAEAAPELSASVAASTSWSSSLYCSHQRSKTTVCWVETGPCPGIQRAR